ncbi:tyrosine/serine/threonine protein phosphatase PPS1 [Aspergillus stella-maris]|uniref:tyrosine/serine/threonine protein phosphatase PPS1 n=1 Tax=Aspergillus stella-maris TaxID=1810926 RepID=UPI003CCCE504
MATVVVQAQQPLRHTTPPPGSKTPALSLNRTSSPVPNKHIPVCPTGPSPIPSRTSSPAPKEDASLPASSPLHPPDAFPKISDSPPLYSIEIEILEAAVKHCSSQPLPDPNLMFPWLHGLHPENQLQVGFFTNRRRSLRRTPKCWRGLTIVKVGGDMSSSRLKGAVTPDAILAPSGLEFLAVDPREGFSVRNFQIQTAKVAPLSDVIVYGEDGATAKQLLEVASRITAAQHHWRYKHDHDQTLPSYNTFVVSCPFSDIERRAPSLVAVDSSGHLTNQVVDLFQLERYEMCTMSRATEFSNNVWQGPTPDYLLQAGVSGTPLAELFDLMIEANDLAGIPGPRYLANLAKRLASEPQRLEFPSSGSLVSPSPESRDVDDLINTLRWMYYLANPEIPETDAEGDIPMDEPPKTSRKILIHCPDGYTESSLLVIAYTMFAEGIPASEAWLRLHREKKRNFFAYPTDVKFLRDLQERILHESPANPASYRVADPHWFRYCDGSLPSRILPYMYLGNLSHANNPEMLWELGIRRVLSIGEAVSWSDDDLARMGSENVMHITKVQDNGIDPLTQEFDRCLEFIRKGKADGTATLVHCRVGVSRSATICIAEVMAALNLSFPRAYCYVRARRLNVIIQPHLRFVYELLKWEELQQKKNKQPLKRELEWATVAREIALMNKPYSR